MQHHTNEEAKPFFLFESLPLSLFSCWKHPLISACLLECLCEDSWVKGPCLLISHFTSSHQATSRPLLLLNTPQRLRQASLPIPLKEKSVCQYSVFINGVTDCDGLDCLHFADVTFPDLYTGLINLFFVKKERRDLGKSWGETKLLGSISDPLGKTAFKVNTLIICPHRSLNRLSSPSDCQKRPQMINDLSTASGGWLWVRGMIPLICFKIFGCISCPK